MRKITTLNFVRPPQSRLIVELLCSSYDPAMEKKGSLFKLPFSYALAGILAFVALDLANHLLIQPDLYGTANKSWIWWAVKNYREKSKTPDTVLMGSSLIIALQNDGDATFYHENLDAVKHYKSRYLEEKAKSYLHKTISTASFAIGGQTASDAYAIFATMLSGKSAPKTLIWGVAPRDFVDRTYPHPEETETVKYLSQISQNSELIKSKNRTFWQKVEDMLNRTSSIYARRGEYAGKEKAWLAALLAKVSPSYAVGTKVRTPDWLLGEMNAAYGEDNVEGEWICRPFGEKLQPHLDNSNEYKQRYNPFLEDLYLNQIAYGNKLLQIAQRQKTKVVLINMPLRKSNLALLPAGIYTRYLSDIKTAAKANDALFIDMNDPSLFTSADFWDPVHLNGVGSIRFLNYLCENLQRANLL
jgi:hypothetical protein